MGCDRESGDDAEELEKALEERRIEQYLPAISLDKVFASSLKF